MAKIIYSCWLIIYEALEFIFWQ